MRGFTQQISGTLSLHVLSRKRGDVSTFGHTHLEREMSWQKIRGGLCMIELVLSFVAQTDQGMILFSRLKDATSVRRTGFGAFETVLPY